MTPITDRQLIYIRRVSAMCGRFGWGRLVRHVGLLQRAYPRD